MYRTQGKATLASGEGASVPVLPSQHSPATRAGNLVLEQQEQFACVNFATPRSRGAHKVREVNNLG